MSIRVRSLPGLARLGLCALCLPLVSVQPSPAQGLQYSHFFARGTHFFRRLLSDMDLRPIEDLERLKEEPENKLLIVLGDAELLPQRGFNLEPFVRRGGAVLLATDRNCISPIQSFGVRIVGSRVTVPEKSEFAYKQCEDCIFIERSPDARAQALPLFANLSIEGVLTRVATNRPGYLRRAPDCELPVLAAFPPGCSTTESRIVPSGRPGLRLRPESRGAHLTPFGGVAPGRRLPFAVGGSWGEGRILILSDHSVFINEMMWQPDNENFLFAHNCVDWLSNGGRRREVLFLEEGQVQTSFKFPLKVPPGGSLPPLKATVEIADKGLGELERENAFNRAIRSVAADLSWPPERWFRTVIIASTVALMLLGLTRLSQARYRKEKIAPLPASGGAPGPGPTNLFEQRQQAMVEEGNLWEAARALARQAVESALGERRRVSTPVLAALTQPRPPALALRGSWLRKWRIRRRFKRLWQLAYGTEPVRISPRRLRRLNQEIEEINTNLTAEDAEEC
jgi:hypothetical protein